MNSRVIGGAAVAITVIFLFFSSGCGNSKKEAQEAAKTARDKAEAELENVKERDERAKEIIQNKFDAVSKFDSRFQDYAPRDAETESGEELEGEEGTLKGYVAVWGAKPGTVGSSRGMRVSLRGEDGYYYYAWIDSENWYRISAPAGEYTLIIEEPGYKRFEKSVTVEGGRERLVAPIGLQNE
jgi:hypothetical protein